MKAPALKATKASIFKRLERKAKRLRKKGIVRPLTVMWPRG